MTKKQSLNSENKEKMRIKSQTVKMNMLYLIQKIVATVYKQYY